MGKSCNATRITGKMAQSFVWSGRKGPNVAEKKRRSGGVRKWRNPTASTALSQWFADRTAVGPDDSGRACKGRCAQTGDLVRRRRPLHERRAAVLARADR